MPGAGLCSSRMLEVATHPSPLGWEALNERRLGRPGGRRDGSAPAQVALVCGEVPPRTSGGQIEEIRAGDIVYTPADQWHWHGAAPGHFMTHLSITEAVPGDQRRKPTGASTSPTTNTTGTDQKRHRFGSRCRRRYGPRTIGRGAGATAQLRPPAAHNDRICIVQRKLHEAGAADQNGGSGAAVAPHPVTFRDRGRRLQQLQTAAAMDRGSGPTGTAAMKESGEERAWPLIMTWCPYKHAVNTCFPRWRCSRGSRNGSG